MSDVNDDIQFKRVAFGSGMFLKIKCTLHLTYSVLNFTLECFKRCNSDVRWEG